MTERTVLITGASTGIGRACALDLDSRGWRVFAGVRALDDGEALRRSASRRLEVLQLDITDAGDVQQAARAIEQVEAGLDGLVNNAGVGVGGPLEYVDLDDLRWQFEVNVIGQVAVTQALLPALRKASGRIVNVGSMSGKVATPFLAPYCASKFALEAISDALRMELRPWGIHSCIVEPGAVRTEIWGKANEQIDRSEEKSGQGGRHRYAHAFRAMRAVVDRQQRAAVPPERVAEAVHHALSSRRPKTRYPVGPDARTGAILRWALPDAPLDWVLRKANRLP